MAEIEPQRLAAGVEYDGSLFLGWQTQRQTPTVQPAVEAALSAVANAPITVHCAGRTDTGVHAWCQVIHFDAPVQRPMRAWLLGANTELAEGVALLWVKPVSSDFHARYSALSRRYCYRILNRPVRPALDRQRMAWVRKPLDAPRMHEAAQALLGEHDFSSFRAAGCQSNTAQRRLDAIRVVRQGDQVDIEVEANAFLYHMVRNIAGSLIAVGLGERPVDELARLLSVRDRRQAAMTAPPQGLYFCGVRYPESYGLTALTGLS